MLAVISSPHPDYTATTGYWVKWFITDVSVVISLSLCLSLSLSLSLYIFTSSRAKIIASYGRGHGDMESWVVCWHVFTTNFLLIVCLNWAYTSCLKMKSEICCKMTGDLCVLCISITRSYICPIFLRPGDIDLWSIVLKVASYSYCMCNNFEIYRLPFLIYKLGRGRT